MSDFREELYHKTVSKNDFIIELRKKFDKAARCAFEHTVYETYEQIRKIYY